MSARRSTAQKGDGPVAVYVSLGQAFSMAETAVSDSAEPPRRRLRGDWARAAARRAAGAVRRAAVPARRRAGAARHRARPPLHRRPHRGARDPSGLQHPHRPDRRLDLRRSQLRDVARLRPARPVPDIAPDQARLGARRWLNNGSNIDSLTAERVTLDRLPKTEAEPEDGADAARLRHPYRRAANRPARDRARSQRGSRAAAALRGKADVRSGRALVELAARCERRRRPPRSQPRRRARPQQVRPRRAA